MRKKKTVLIFISATAIFIAICCVFAYFVFGIREQVSYDIEKWNGLAEKINYLPSADETGGYTELKCKYLHKDISIFQSDAYILRVEYGDELFERQKEHIKNNYIFQDEVEDRGEETATRKTFFELDGFEFQMLSLSEYGLYYPKEMAFIGVSEEDNAIAYVYYYDFDLDYISQSFPDFLIEECGWE